MPSFQYVFIPADTSEPLEEKRLEYTAEKEVECLLDAAKAHFGRVRPAKTAAQRAAQLTELRSKLPAGTAQALDARLLEMATSLNMVESVALLPNTPSQGYVGVNIYVDDEGAIRDAPINPRASELAALCGKPLQVRGDAFVARVLDNGDDFKRMDLKLADISSSAPWVIAAREKNLAAQAGPTAEAMFRQMQPHNGGAGASNSNSRMSRIEEVTAETLKDEGNQAFKRGDFETAARLYTQALEMDSELWAARNNRAQAYLRLEKWQSALEDAETVLGRDADNVKALLRFATAAKNLGLQKKAQQSLERVLVVQPENKEAQTGLDELKKQDGNSFQPASA